VHKNKGYATQLLDICEEDARKSDKSGVCIVTRKGSFMIGKEIFLKRGYEVVDEAPPDFELLVKRFKADAPPPHFTINEHAMSAYQDGLTIIRADQCPYTVKNVAEIVQAAEEKYGLKPKVVTLTDYKQAQKSPGAFGIFCVIYNGEIVAHHPISSTRFTNIMDKLTGN
jgi:hypothetical protein